MAVPETTQTVDVSQALATMLMAVDGLRVYWYVSDTVRPPAAVIGQPDVDFTDNSAGFCAATWTFPVTLVTARSNDRDAQVEMSRLLMEAAKALTVAPPDGIWMVEPTDARPIPVTVSGQELPGYQLNVRIRA